MIILGLDPGLARTSFGVLDTERPNPYIADGCLETAPHLPPGRRLTILANQLHDLVKRYSVDQVVIEQIYFGRNKTTAMATAQVHGVFLYVLDQYRLPIEYVTPPEVKKQMTGHGFASKQQVQQAVTDRLQLSAIPTPDDAADALAVALTYGA